MAWTVDGEAFNYRFAITSQNAEVVSDETDFPFYYDLSMAPAGFWLHVKSDGGDIRVTLTDETTRVPVDMRNIDTGTSTGEIIFKADTNSTGDQDYWVYYGNAALSQPAVGAANGQHDTYRDSIIGCWPHDQDPSTTDAIDRTQYGNDGARTGWSSVDLIDMKMFKGLRCSSGKYFSVPDSAELNPSSITISTLFNTGNAGFQSTDYLLSKGTAGAPIRVNYELVRANTFMTLQFYDGSWHVAAGTQALILNRDVYGGATFNDSTKDAKVYTGQEGTAWNAVTTNLAGQSLPTGANTLQLFKSGFVAPTNFFDHTEQRIYDEVNSPGHMETECNNTRDNDTFWATGAEEENITPSAVTTARAYFI